MLPKNSMDFVDSVAEELNINKELVSDYVSFFYGRLRNQMSNFKDVIFTVPNLGKFTTSKNLLIKEKLKVFEKRRMFQNVIRKGEITNLDNAIVQIDKDLIKFNENKLAKLKWHKENGDPYKKYNKEQEENCRRHIERLKKEIECGGYIKKENGDVQPMQL